MKKSLLAASILFAAGSVSAEPFYLDVGINFDAPIVAPNKDKECDTCTSMKDELTYQYQSTTVITDTDANGIDADDTLVTSAGLAVGPLGSNNITSFDPAEGFGIDSNNGYGGGNWLLSFSISNWAGEVDSVTGAGVPLFSYGPGLLELFITFDGLTFINFMDVNIIGGGATGLGIEAVGLVDFTNVTNLTYANLFHSGTDMCNGSDGFYDIWANCGISMPITFFADFNTNVTTSQFTNNLNGTYSLTSKHDGSATFVVSQIPEPGTLALMGISLLAMGGMARRNKKA